MYTSCHEAGLFGINLLLFLCPSKVPGGTTVLVELAPDIHICGLCKQQFSNLDAFVAHKQSGCQLTTTPVTAPSTVQFVAEETEPATQTTTTTISSETQTITGTVQGAGRMGRGRQRRLATSSTSLGPVRKACSEPLGYSSLLLRVFGQCFSM